MQNISSFPVKASHYLIDLICVFFILFTPICSCALSGSEKLANHRAVILPDVDLLLDNIHRFGWDVLEIISWNYGILSVNHRKR
jgi:hypothetical protein